MAWTNTKKFIAVGLPVFVVAVVALVLFLKRQDIADHVKTSAGQSAVAQHIATPLDLSAQYAHGAFDQGGGSSYWHDVPWRFQVFNGVPLQIDGLMYLWG